MQIKQKKKMSFSKEKILSYFKENDMSFLDITPYKRVNENGYIIDSKNHFQALLKVKSRDLFSLNESELNLLISNFTDINRVYLSDYKILTLTYPSSTNNQKMFWKSKIKKYRSDLANSSLSLIEKNKLKVKLKLANDNFRRVKWVEDMLEELNFFFFIYGDSEKELQKNIQEMIRIGGTALSLELMNKEEATNIIKKLMNMNTN